MRRVPPTWKEIDGMVKLKVKELVRDDKLYPREHVSMEHVQRMIDAAAAGVEFPPIIVCRQSKRIVDGRHRFEMAQRTMGPEGEIGCVLKSYRNQEEFFLDAVRYNAEHGLTLSSADRMHVLKIGEKLKISVAATAGALRMSVHAAGKFTPVTVSQPASREPLGVTVNPRFARATASPELRPALLPILGSLDRVIHWLEENELPSDEAVVKRLERLRELLNHEVATV